MTALADTGAIYALFDRHDEWHQRMSVWWTTGGASVRLPVPTLTEITYLLRRWGGTRPEARFVRQVAGGAFVLEPLLDEDYVRVADLMDAYSDLPLGFVDASVVAMAERLDIVSILTTDRRHFGVVRPAHCERLRLVP